MDARRAAPRLLALGVAAGLIGITAWSLLHPAPVHSGPNVLFIVWDTVRADRIGLYGYDLPTTPHLDQLAKESVVFDRAISSAMWTPPSHSTMFTGLAPSHHGVKATYKWLDDHHVTLAEWLGEHGYATYAFSANPYIAATSNITQGFDVVDNTFEGRWKRAARRSTKRKLIPEDASSDISPSWRPLPGQRASGMSHPFKDAAPVAHEALVSWLDVERDTGAPWFAFINMMEAHIPRVPSATARGQVMNDEEFELALSTNVAQIRLLSYTFGKHSYTPGQLNAINRVYDAALIDLDHATHEMLMDLGQRGYLDDTVVVITSDHGENLGDHGMFGHKFSLYDTLVHVPLLIWYPDKLRARRVAHPVSTVNLFTTVLGILGISPPDTDLDGTLDLLSVGPRPSFSELVEATPVSVNRVDELYGIDDKERWLRTFRSVVDGDWKFIEASDGAHELYDLATDPKERLSLYPDEPERSAAMLAQVRAWADATPDYDPTQRTQGDKLPEFNEDAKRMLEQLGYLQEDKK